jgi:hypothetical protein
MTKLTTGGKVVIGIVIALVVGGAAALIVGLTGGGSPNAAQVLKSDGYTPMNIGAHNTDPGDISSEAFGTQGAIPGGNAEIVIVLTPQGQSKEGTLQQEFNDLGTGLSFNTSGNIIRVSGPDSSWTQLGSAGF